MSVRVCECECASARELQVVPSFTRENRASRNKIVICFRAPKITKGSRRNKSKLIKLSGLCFNITHESIDFAVRLLLADRRNITFRAAHKTYTMHAAGLKILSIRSTGNNDLLALTLARPACHTYTNKMRCATSRNAESIMIRKQKGVGEKTMSLGDSLATRFTSTPRALHNQIYSYHT